MKRNYLLLLSCFIAEFAYSQEEINLNAIVTKSGASIIKGDIFIKSISYEVESPTGRYGSYFLYGIQKDKEFKVDAFELNKNFALEPKSNSLQDYLNIQNIKSLYVLSRIKDLKTMRQKMEDDAYKYINELDRMGLLIDDPYMESYVYSLLSTIAPKIRIDGFPYNIKVVLVNDNTMNMGIYPNGTLLINSGILARIHSEDELVAALAHELGHFISNHALQNVFHAEQVNKRAEAWAAFATMTAAVAETYMGNNGYYVDGSLTKSVSILSSAIAEEVKESLGLKFSIEQEEAADQIAYKILELTGRNKNALSTLFKRFEEVYKSEGNWLDCYSTSDHPSIYDRINKYGSPYSTVDDKFEQKVSFLVSETAVSLFSLGRFTQALELVNQNIKNNVATDDDYIVKSQCLLNLFNDAKYNEEAYQLVKKAKQINPNNSNIYKTEIIATLRLQKNQEAESLLSAYMTEIKKTMATLDIDSQAYYFFQQEYDWARRMIVKIKGLK